MIVLCSYTHMSGSYRFSVPMVGVELALYSRLRKGCQLASGRDVYARQ